MWKVLFSSWPRLILVLPSQKRTFGIMEQQQQPFYGPLSRTTRVSRYQKKHSPTHHPDHHPICISVAIFLHNLCPCPLWSTSWSALWSPPPHIPYISSPNQCLLFATNAHTIATCFAISVLYHTFLVFLSTPYLELCVLP